MTQELSRENLKDLCETAATADSASAYWRQRSSKLSANIAMARHIALKMASRLPDTVGYPALENAALLGLGQAVNRYKADGVTSFRSFAEDLIYTAIYDCAATVGQNAAPTPTPAPSKPSAAATANRSVAHGSNGADNESRARESLPKPPAAEQPSSAANGPTTVVDGSEWFRVCAVGNLRPLEVVDIDKRPRWSWLDILLVGSMLAAMGTAIGSLWL